MKQLAISIAGVIIGALIVGSFAVVYFANAGGYYTAPAQSAKQDSVVTVGPDTNVQVAASTSRAYLRIENDDANYDIYCSADGDAPATSGEGIKLASSTNAGGTAIYEISLDVNGYDGAVRCTSLASTSLLIYELKRN